MITEKTGGYISRLEFNTGESLDVKKNDIVVLVLITQEKVNH